MSDERFKAWLSFWQFVLGTVVVGVFSSIISHQIQTREVEIKEQDANGRFLEQAMQEDVGVRRRLAQYFSHVTRSSELRARWADYAGIVEAEYQGTVAEKNRLLAQAQDQALDPAAREQLQERISQLERELSPRASAAPAIAPRVYLHIAREEQRERAREIANVLRAASVAVPGIELRENSPANSELRYFRTIDRVEAEGLAATVQGVHPDVAARYVPGYETSTRMRPRHFELWLAKKP
jgi:hypothetical protein